VATRLVRLAVGPLSSHFSASFIARLALYHIVPISLLTQLSTQNVFLQDRFTSSERAIIPLACAPHSNPQLDLLSLKRKNCAQTNIAGCATAIAAVLDCPLLDMPFSLMQ
jgi:hypothetical protein